ncbi:unnamed protein product [Microthlaspi erraticum]|uniref:DUF4283 domain-containing protein n=1 Tax=Microthlaspi erraticum TaxID=1685480 RepID=A0A6D2J8Q4_9BRAS|nr:unnamed protein product [Microthlaspi erraticum]
MIGRCMNPAAQDVNALLHHMPRFWKMEERVAGADLGMGRFQFDFDNEEDIVEVFKLEPFHFDYWMILLVRWEPVVDPTYPSAIKFWVRMMGIPLHFWTEPTFRSIGEAIGEVIEVDIDGGRVRVCLEGYKPLIFETTVEFYGGEETVVTLRYERLFGVCRECSSLCHDVPQVIRRAREERESQKRREEKPDGGAMSYKGVVINGPGGDSGAVRQTHHGVVGDPKGKGKAVEQREERGKWQTGFRGNGKHRGESSGTQRKPAGFGARDQRKRINQPMTTFRSSAEQVVTIRTTGLQGNGTENGSGGGTSPTQQSAKKVRKAIDFTSAVEGMDESGNRRMMAEGEKVGEDAAPEVSTNILEPVLAVNENMGQEEGEDGEIWWDEVIEEGEAENMIEEEEAEKVLEEPADPTESQGENAMQIDETNGSERHLGAEQFVEVEAKEVGRGKHVTARKVGVKKKPVRPSASVGGGALKRFVQGAKTPRKKQAVKASSRIGDKPTGNGMEDDPAEGSEATSQAT